MKNNVRQYLRELPPSDIADWVIEQAITIQQIPAPTFDESARARHVTACFEVLGLQSIRTDDVLNVYGYLPGKDETAPALMVMAHTDTVFPAKTDLSVKRSKRLIHGPGLGDNSIGVAGMLGFARMLQQQDIQPACGIWFVATSREEGLGDLEGARAAYTALADDVQAVINIEGLAYGYVYHAGIAVRRLHVTAKAEGGHSWLHFGRASAVHQIMRLGSEITNLDVPETPRTTYNIGMVEGGHSINSIATDAGLWLDMRSEDAKALATLESRVRGIVRGLTTANVKFEIEVVGDRPAGQIEPRHPLVQGALAALAEFGVKGTLQVGSTDGNIPLSHGCPTVTVGVTRGGNAHRLDEYIETEYVTAGMYQLAALTLAAADHLCAIES